jgi:O-antigen/teichoic acid export membrane protein
VLLTVFKKLASYLHLKFFLEGAGERTKTFLHGIGWTIAAALLAKAITGLTTLYAARWMGPAEFGEANLSLAAGLIIQIPMLCGIPMALIHFIPGASEHEKKQWMHDGLWLASGLLATTSFICVVLHQPLARALNVPGRLFSLSIVYAAGIWIFTI